MPDTVDMPFVTIVMPIRNEADFIERSLRAVLMQDYPADRMEIIVADGMSTDQTRAIVDKLRGTHPHLRIVDNPGRIVPIGINIALRQARGEIIVRVDGHCEIASDYVRRCVNYLVGGQVEGVGGPMETVGETRTAHSIAVAMSSPFGVGNSAFRTVMGKTMQVDTVPFPAYRRDAMVQAGLYDEELVRNQDDEYNSRLRALGFRILLAADIHSRYSSRSSLSSLWRQYFQYGYWKVRVLQKHPLQARLRQFAPPLFVFMLLGSALVAPFAKSGQVCLLAVVGSYLVANLTATILTVARKGWRCLPLLPLVYAILHLSYGSGLLVGLVRFAHRWGDMVGLVSSLGEADV